MDNPRISPTYLSVRLTHHPALRTFTRDAPRTCKDAVMSGWDVDAAKSALDTELHVNHQGEDSSPKTHVDVAKRKFTEASALAADRIIHTALYSESESLAFKAAVYITDRVMGRVSDMGIKRDEDDDLVNLVKRVTQSN